MIYCRELYKQPGVFFERLDYEKSQFLRSQLTGGLSTVFTRLAIRDVSYIDPHNYIGSDRKLVKSIGSIDYNSMYVSNMAEKSFPCFGFSAFRNFSNQFRLEKVAGKLPSALLFIQYLAQIVFKKFFQSALSTYGERRLFINGTKFYMLDGYCEMEDGFVAAEFLGCAVHGHSDSGCKLYGARNRPEMPNVLNPKKTNGAIYSETLARLDEIRNHDKCKELRVMWECSWAAQLDTDPETKRFVEIQRHTIMPAEVKKTMTLPEMINHITVTGKICGFLQCSLACPDDVMVRRRQFPPIITKRAISFDELDPNQKLLALKYGRFKKPETQLNSVFNANDVIISTNLFKFYVNEMGYECTAISRVLQFAKNQNAGKKFLESLSDLKRIAMYEGETHKIGMYKLLGNSIYGLSLFTSNIKNRLVTPKLFKNLSQRTQIISSQPCGSVGDPYGLIQVSYEAIGSNARNRQSSYPLQLGVMTLCAAKISINRIAELFSVYIPANHYAFSLSDTDSITLLLSTPSYQYTDLRTLVPPSLLPAFFKDYHKLFGVAPDHPLYEYHSKTAGLLHPENEGVFAICLSPKLALIHNPTSPGFGKLTQKGISHNILFNERFKSVRTFFASLFSLPESDDYYGRDAGMTVRADNRIFNYSRVKRAMNALAPKFYYGTCFVHPIPHELVNDSRFNKYPCDCENIEELWDQIEKLI